MVDISGLVDKVTEVAGPDREMAFDDREEFSYERPPAVSIETTAASVTVIGEDRTDVSAHLEKRADDPERLSDIQLEATGGGERSLRLVVDEETDAVVDITRLHAELTVRVPRDLVVEWVETTAGSVTLRDVTVETVETDGGSVEATGVQAGELQTSVGSVTVTDGTVTAVETTAGSVTLSAVAGDASVETNAGSVEVHGIDGYLTAETTAGSIEVTDAEGIDGLETKTGGIDAEFRTLSGPTTIQSHAGGLTVTAGPEVSADVSLSTRVGSISAPGFAHESSGVGGTANGQVGGGGPELTVETDLGGIVFRHSSPSDG